MVKITKCEHKHVSYDKINDYNYCQDCMKIFYEDEVLLFLEEEDCVDIVDEVENNLSRLNNL